jgi:uncharacterized phosphatase
MLRAKETKEIAAARLRTPHLEIEELGECTMMIWKEMSQLRMYSTFPLKGIVQLFADRVLKGLHYALSQPGPTLIIAHGGVHWAICRLLSIKTHPWSLQNCGIVHFSWTSDGQWNANRLA